MYKCQSVGNRGVHCAKLLCKVRMLHHQDVIVASVCHCMMVLAQMPCICVLCTQNCHSIMWGVPEEGLSIKGVWFHLFHGYLNFYCLKVHSDAP